MARKQIRAAEEMAIFRESIDLKAAILWDDFDVAHW